LASPLVIAKERFKNSYGLVAGSVTATRRHQIKQIGPDITMRPSRQLVNDRSHPCHFGIGPLHFGRTYNG